MEVEIDLPSFLTAGDEQRFFQGLKDLTAIREFQMNDGRLLLRMEIRFLTKSASREFIALLTRYQVSLAPLRCLSETNKKFIWLADAHEYWHQSMFGDPQTVPERKIIHG
ncbi:MAG: hypothetical protein LW731_04735 [Oxalobacteraceae bacterium]|jgi:hypothetical protein|nr:hypothetical protein [Oxalobacteraceae bacterium]